MPAPTLPIFRSYHSRSPRKALATSVALALLLAPIAGFAGSITGPGTTHTVNPGDARESWFVTNGAALTIQPGGGTNFIQVENATLTGRDVDMTGRVLLLNGSTADIVGGTMLLNFAGSDAGGVSSGSTMSIDDFEVTSVGRGFSASGAGSLLTISNSSITTGGEALSVHTGAQLVADNVQVSADDSDPGAVGAGLRMYDGSASVSNSTVFGHVAGVKMGEAGELSLDSSAVSGTFYGLLMGVVGTPGTANATVANSTISGSTGVYMTDGATLSMTGSTVQSTDPSAGSAAAYVSNSMLTARQGSSIEGGGVGILLNGGNVGKSVVEIDQSRIVSGTGPAITAPGTANADVFVRNNSVIEAGNGVLLDVNAGQVNFVVSASSLTGDIIAGGTAEVNVTLDDQAFLDGKISNGGAVSITNAGWRLSGSSTIGQLSLGGLGAVALGDGTAFNTLTVSGDYVGAGGTLLFNTVLGDDASASDKLIIGGSTSGQTNVTVNNVGGAGAQTVNGIQLIQVAGASNGVFTLAGRAVGGQYEYFLHQGTAAAPTDGNWYLRSELPVAPDPCLADPTLPGCTPIVVPPEPVLRPEPGAYLANQAAATQMFGMRLQDRTGGTARGSSERGAWARVSRSQADYGVIADQLGVNGDTSVLQVGTDLLSWGAESRGQFGVMLGGGRANNTVTSRATGYSAKGKVEGQVVGVYASWLQDPVQTTGLYVDAWAQYAQFKNTVQGDALAKEHYDSDAKTASVEAGYSFKVLDSASTAMFLEPQLQLSYTDFSADRHVETNGTVIDGSDAGGLTSRVGVRLFGHANSDVGNRVQPFVAVNWIHGADDNSLRFDGERLEGGLPKDRYEAKAGASLQLGQRWTAWGDMGLQKGQGGYRDVAGQIGLRASW